MGIFQRQDLWCRGERAHEKEQGGKGPGLNSAAPCLGQLLTCQNFPIYKMEMLMEVILSLVLSQPGDRLAANVSLGALPPSFREVLP